MMAHEQLCKKILPLLKFKKVATLESKNDDLPLLCVESSKELKS